MIDLGAEYTNVGATFCLGLCLGASFGGDGHGYLSFGGVSLGGWGKSFGVSTEKSNNQSWISATACGAIDGGACVSGGTKQNSKIPQYSWNQSANRQYRGGVQYVTGEGWQVGSSGSVAKMMSLTQLASNYAPGTRTPVSPAVGVLLGILLTIVGLGVALNYRGIAQKIHDMISRTLPKVSRKSQSDAVEFQRSLGLLMGIFGIGVAVYEVYRMIR